MYSAVLCPSLQARRNYLTAKQTVTRKQIFQEEVNKETLVSSFTMQFDVKHACNRTTFLDKLPRTYLNHLPVKK